MLSSAFQSKYLVALLNEIFISTFCFMHSTVGNVGKVILWLYSGLERCYTAVISALLTDTESGNDNFKHEDGEVFLPFDCGRTASQVRVQPFGIGASARTLGVTIDATVNSGAVDE